MALCNHFSGIVFPPGLPWRDSALALSQILWMGPRNDWHSWRRHQGSHKWHLTPSDRHRFKDGTRNDAASNKWTRNVESGSKQTQYMNVHDVHVYIHKNQKWGVDSWQGLDSIKPSRKSVDLTMPSSNRSFGQKSNPSAFWRLYTCDRILGTTTEIWSLTPCRGL